MGDTPEISPLKLSGNVAQNWRVWKMRFQNYMLAMEFNKKVQVTQCAQFLHYIGEEAFKIYTTFEFLEEEKNRLDILFDKFETYFLSKENLNLSYERYKFFMYRQDPEQTFEQFVIELKKMAMKCYLENLQDSLIKVMIICGTNNKVIRQHLLDYDTLKLDDAIRLCKGIEASTMRVSAMESNSLYQGADRLNGVYEDNSYSLLQEFSNRQTPQLAPQNWNKLMDEVGKKTLQAIHSNVNEVSMTEKDYSGPPVDHIDHSPYPDLSQAVQHNNIYEHLVHSSNSELQWKELFMPLSAEPLKNCVAVKGPLVSLENRKCKPRKRSKKKRKDSSSDIQYSIFNNYPEVNPNYSITPNGIIDLIPLYKKKLTHKQTVQNNNNNSKIESKLSSIKLGDVVPATNQPIRPTQVKRYEQGDAQNTLMQALISQKNKKVTKDKVTNMDTFNYNVVDKEEINSQIVTVEMLNLIIELLFEEAVNNPHFSDVYAVLCKDLAFIKVPTSNSRGDKPEFVNLQRLIITRCHYEIQMLSGDESKRNKKLNEIKACTNHERKQDLQFELDEYDRQLRIKYVGIITFMGELYKQHMLKVKTMIRCLDSLLENNDERRLECLCKLLRTIGKQLELEKNDALVEIIGQIKNIVDKKEVKGSSRLRFMLQGVIDLRNSKWKPLSQHSDSDFKVIDQIEKKAKYEELLSQIKNVSICTEDQLEKSVNNSLDKYISGSCSVEDFFLEISTVIPLSYYPTMIRNSYLRVLKKSKPARLKTASLFAQLMKTGHIILEEYCAGLECILSQVNKMKNKNPIVWDYLAEILGDLICEEVLPLDRLCKSFKVLRGQGLNAAKLLTPLFKLVVGEKGPDFLQKAWQASGLRLSDFISSSQTKRFMKDNKFEFLLGDGASASARIK